MGSHSENGDTHDGAAMSGRSMDELLKKKRKLEDDLQRLEIQIYNLETSYLEETWGFGNAVKGWEAYLSNRTRMPSTASGAGGGGNTKKMRFKDTDRIFSFSSATSAKAVGEQANLGDGYENADDSDTSVTDVRKHRRREGVRGSGALLTPAQYRRMQNRTRTRKSSTARSAATPVSSQHAHHPHQPHPDNTSATASDDDDDGDGDSS